MKVLVIGAALSGIAVSKLLNKKGYEVYLTDSKAIDNKQLLQSEGIQVFDNGHPEMLKTLEYAFIVKNPGIPYHVPFVKHFVDKKINIYNEIEVASWYAPNYRYAAITGTNGKTTITTLLEHILKYKDQKSCAVGNIGRPLSELVLEHEDETIDLAVEIAAFQLLGCEKFHPIASVCTNLTVDHVDYFQDVEKYYDAKMLVYKNQIGDDWFLCNIDDAEIVKRAVNVNCRIIDFSLEKECDLCLKENKVYLLGEYLFDVDDVHLVGKHNLSNCMVAAALAFKMGVEPTIIKTAIQNFKGVAHRIEYVGEINEIKYYNDSKGTNCDATKIALKAFEKPVLLLAGGYDKKTGFKEIIPYLDKVKMMYVFGETADQLVEIYPQAKKFTTMEEAFKHAVNDAKAKDVVLLSPMCASWDQFPNYEVRGQEFCKMVNNLMKK